MKQPVGMYRFCSWLILIGLFTQSFTPLIAAVQPTSVKNQTIVDFVNEYVSVDDFNMRDIIVHVVEDAVASGVHENLSESLVRCYQRIIAGHTTLHVDDVIEAMPELLQHAVMHPVPTKVSSGESGVNSTFKDRAPRPSVNNANNAIVGCNGGCDLTQLIQLLASIKERIGTVHDNPCCDSILGILGDACNVPCIGENSSISEVLCEILDCCTTVQSDIQTLTVNVDLNGVFTVLEDINNTLTECCDEIIIDIEDTQTLICDKFEQTWTILADLNDSLTVELNNIFTFLVDINDTLTECCDEIIIDIEDTQTLLCDKFEQTWTILANLDLSATVLVDLDGVFTVLDTIEQDIFDSETLLCDKFEQTWTILDSIENKIDQLPTVTFMFTGTVVADLTGVFTVLDTIEDDIFDTQTLICDKFEQTWTILANLNFNLSTTVLVDLNGIFTTLDTIEDDIFNTQTLICDKFEQTWTILADLNISATISIPCAPTPLFQTDVDGNGEIQLTETGINYCLAENITGTIIITGDNVTLDGNDRVVTGRVVVDASDVIVEHAKVQPQAPTDNTDAANAGIEITSTSSCVQIRDCVVKCEDITASINVAGRVALSDAGFKTLIENVSATGGTGGVNGAALGPSGGDAFLLTGIGTTMLDSFGCGGEGGDTTIIGGSGGMGGSGISVDDGLNVKITSCRFTGGSAGLNVITAIAGDNGIGVNLSQGQNIVIEDCCIIGETTGLGVFGNSSVTNVEIIGCVVENCTLNGILLASDIVSIRNCIIQNPGNFGFNIFSVASNITVCDCVVNNAGSSGFFIDGDNCLIQNCKANACASDGFVINANASNVQVLSCRATSNTGIGIDNNAGVNAQFYNNVSLDNGTNYTDVDLVRQPGPQTGYYVNISDGPQDCDLCDIFTVLAAANPCAPTPLFQSDVDGNGEIQLTETGINYCLAENITGTIIITGANVTLDGNDRVVTGRVIVDASEVIVEHAKVHPQAPVNDADAANAGIEITSTSSCIQIRKCIVKCTNTELELLGAGINGRTGIISDAYNVLIIDCIINGGSGADGSTGSGGIGGAGLEANGNETIIKNTIAQGGIGGNGQTTGGQGNVGIFIGGADSQVVSSRGIGGAGGSGTTGNGGVGNTGISVAGDRGIVYLCKAIAGNGGNGTNGGSSGEALRSSNIVGLTVSDCVMCPGDGGDAGDGGIGGAGGNGIFLSAIDSVTINNCSISGGGIPGLGGTPNAGNGIELAFSISRCIQICNCKINRIAGSGIISRNPGSEDIQIRNCEISNSSENGIRLNGDNIQIIGVNIVSSGSHGIWMDDVDVFQIKQSVIENSSFNGILISSTSSNGQVANCCSNSNGDAGFRNDSGTVVFASNLASFNTTNYAGTSTPTSATIAAASSYWVNVTP